MAVEILGFMEITEGVSAANHVMFSTMLFSLELTNDIHSIDSIKIPCTYVTLNKTLSGSYLNITGKLDTQTLETLLALVEDSSVKIVLSMVGVDNTIVPIIIETSPLSEYRLDEGVTSISLSIVSKEPTIDSTGYNIVIDKLMAKDKKILSNGDIEWTYSLDPLIYRHIGIGKTITFEGVVSEVSSKSLVMTPEQSTLTVGATEL